MPKQKSKSSVKKRFRISKNGKALCSKPGRGHLHAPFNGSVRRGLRRRIVLDNTWSTLMRRMVNP